MNTIPWFSHSLQPSRTVRQSTFTPVFSTSRDSKHHFRPRVSERQFVLFWSLIVLPDCEVTVGGSRRDKQIECLYIVSRAINKKSPHGSTRQIAFYRSRSFLGCILLRCAYKVVLWRSLRTRRLLFSALLSLAARTVHHGSFGHTVYRVKVEYTGPEFCYVLIRVSDFPHLKDLSQVPKRTQCLIYRIV